MLEILIAPVLAGLFIVGCAGPLGCFVVWRRLAYFGDALAHAALFGIALGLLAGIATELAIVLACVGLALLLARVKQHSALGGDTWLGVLSHGSLALSIIAISLADAGRVDLYSYLFGDLLTADWTDVALIGGTCTVLAMYLWHSWQPLVALCLNEDLATVEGVRVNLHKTLLMLAIALLTAMAMKLVGALLITALLIIPAAAARHCSNSPGQMALLAACAGTIALLLGMLASFFWNLPTGPAIVSAACGLFALGQLKAAK
ncbi:MAG: metal ABC transporter permease [Cellvibrionaceae bacterium]|nr:metal ABC transporter permease [Cellvibrionaceae bacterium]